MTSDSLRILKNIDGLLRQGLFQGQHAPVVSECVQFVDHAIKEGEAAQTADEPVAPKPRRAKKVRTGGSREQS